MKKTVRFTALLLAMISIFSVFGAAAFADVDGADVQEKERSADILKRQLIGFNSDSNKLSVYKAMYNNILTPADSPLTVTEVCYLSEPVYYIEANTEADSMSYLRYISNKMDNELTGGGFAYMEFCAVVEDCLGIVGVEVKAEAVDKEASAQQAWVSALFVEDENAPGWMWTAPDCTDSTKSPCRKILNFKWSSVALVALLRFLIGYAGGCKNRCNHQSKLWLPQRLQEHDDRYIPFSKWRRNFQP